MKLAYFGLPHFGGTHSVFCALRDGLCGHAVEVRWLGLGPPDIAGDSAWRDELRCGVQVDRQGKLAPPAQAAALAEVIEAEKFDGVFVNVLADRTQTNLARYLPTRVLRIMIVHTITPGAYAAARAIRDHVHATVGVSERCRHDLVAGHRFAPDRTFAIPNAIGIAAAQGPRAPRAAGAPLRLLFLGRVEDAAKGAFWLAPIIRALGDSCTLTIAGDGPDLPDLRRRMRGMEERVRFAGWVPPAEVPSVAGSHDVLIMPSRFEGFGLTLAEAMAMGCVPVASRIAGVTDTIVDHGRNGLLFAVGDWRRAAREIERLAAAPKLLTAMSAAAREKTAAAFGADRMIESYMAVISSIARDPPELAPPLDLAQWALPIGLRSGLRTYLPPRVKNWLRLVRERSRAGRGLLLPGAYRT